MGFRHIFFKKLNLIKIDMASYELNIIVNELERIVIRCTQYGGQETRWKKKFSMRDQFFLNIDDHKFLSIHEQAIWQI